MRTERRSKAQLLANELYRAQGPEIQMVRELLGLLIEEVKDSLITSVDDTTLRLQGEAQILSRLLVSLTVEPPKMRTTEQQYAVD